MQAVRFGVVLLVASGCAESKGVLQDPPVVLSDDAGVLTLALQPKYSKIHIGEARYRARAYMDVFAPSTLQVSRGDTFEIVLLNDLPDQSTNLHFDGMSVSPQSNGEGYGDNVFVEAVPGEALGYVVDIPEDHPQGIFSYRASPAGLTAGQVSNGMVGAIVVEGLLDPFSQLENIRQRVFLLKDFQEANGALFSEPDSSQPSVLTVNGQIRPRIRAVPGEMQLWSVVNASPNMAYLISLADHTLYEVARDGNRHTRLLTRDQITLPPAARSQFLVIAKRKGDYPFLSAPLGNRPPDYDSFFAAGLYGAGACADAGVAETTGCGALDAESCTGPQGACTAGGLLATFQVDDDERVAAPQLPSAAEFPALVDFREELRCRRRTFQFSQGPQGDFYTINGNSFDPDRIDAQVDLAIATGCVEEWILENCSGQNQVFHIGQVDFQVLEVNGETVEFTGYQDTITLPFRDCDRDSTDTSSCETQEIDGELYPMYSCPDGEDSRGRVMIRMPFTEVSIGKFTFQSAGASLADGGMMAAIEVCDSDLSPCGTPFPNEPDED